MKNSITLTLTRGVSALCLVALATQLAAQTSAFTYQGALSQNGQPANGTYDFMFRLLDAETDGSAAPVIPINPGVGVTNGLFTTGINFDAENLNGANLWLEISVRTNGGVAFTTLAPRQLLTSAPYAVRAANVSASGISGTYGNAVTFNNAGNSFSGNFSGSAGGLTGLNASELLSGIVPDARLSSAIAREDQVWQLGGNSGTVPGTQFLGTSDNQPFEIRINGQRGVRLEPNTNGAPNVLMGSQVNYISPDVFGSVISGGGTTNYFGWPYTNGIASHFSAIGGGASNFVLSNSPSSTISGGEINSIGSDSSASTVSGGRLNVIEAVSYFATIGGGERNKIRGSSYYSTISGGRENVMGTNTFYSAIGGGELHFIQDASWYSTISGGRENSIVGTHGTVAGGRLNSAGDYSFAAGRRAKARLAGSFVWGDSTDSDVEAVATDSVTMRASGGFRLFSNSSATAGVSLAPNDTAWSVISDRAVKKDFTVVDGREVLEKLAAVPVQSWHYQWESADATPHLGPVAQDFKAAFYPGRDDHSITTLEFDGVALAAIQGLNQKLEARSQESEARSRLIEQKLQEELHRRDAENAELRRQNAELIKRLEAIEARMR